MVIDRRTALLGAAAFAAVRVADAAPPGQTETGQTETGPVETRPGQAQTRNEMPAERVLGIGGFFFRSRDPDALAQWYQLHLGIDPVPTDSKHSAWQQTGGPTAFSPFPLETGYFGSRQQAFMVNFRVRSLDAMVAQLRKSSIEVKVDPEKYPNGRFARLHDPDGNPIELWEPGSS